MEPNSLGEYAYAKQENEKFLLGGFVETRSQ